MLLMTGKRSGWRCYLGMFALQCGITRVVNFEIVLLGQPVIGRKVHFDCVFTDVKISLRQQAMWILFKQKYMSRQMEQSNTRSNGRDLNKKFVI